MNQNKPSPMQRLAQAALAAGLVWAAVMVLRLLSPVLVPFAVAVVLAYVCYPLVRWVQRAVRWRAAAVATTLVGIVGALVGLAALLGPHLATEFHQMGALLGEFAKNSEAAQRAADLLPEGVWAGLRELLDPGVLTTLEEGQVRKGVVKNLTDEEVITGGYLTDDSSGLFTNIFLTEPALYGVTVKKAW